MAEGFLDEVHQEIVEFAERHFEDEEERQGFVDTLLERKGYKRASVWTPPEPSKTPTKKQGSFFKPQK